MTLDKGNVRGDFWSKDTLWRKAFLEVYPGTLLLDSSLKQKGYLSWNHVETRDPEGRENTESAKSMLPMILGKVGNSNPLTKPRINPH